MSKTKIVEKIVRFELLHNWPMVNYVKVTKYRKTFHETRFLQNWILRNTPSPTVWFLRNCGIAQNLSFAKAEKGIFARNDFCEWLCKLLFFFAQNWCAKKEKFCVSFRKNCAKVSLMETLFAAYIADTTVHIWCYHALTKWSSEPGFRKWVIYIYVIVMGIIKCEN